MDKITKILEAIQREQLSQKKEMKELEKNITSNINNNIDEKFHELHIKNQILEQKIESQEKQVDYLVRETKRKNLLFFGVADDERNYFQLEDRITSIITNNMKLPCDKYDIEYVRRIGRKGEIPRPVVITLTTMRKKIEILKSKKSLDNSPYYIKEDFPEKIREIRRNLQTELQELRQQGKKAVLKYDKIVILEGHGSNQRQSKKRIFSQSPITQKTFENNNDSQKTKKSKSEITNFFSPCMNKGSQEEEASASHPNNVNIL